MIAQLVLLASTAAVLVSAQGPPAPQATGCTANSFSKPSLVVSGLQYSSGAGDVSFNVLNRATNATFALACKAAGSSWSACTGPDKLQASVKVSATSATVLVNETWSCNDRAGADR